MKNQEQLYIVVVRIEHNGREFNCEFPTMAKGYDDAEKNANAAAIALGIKIEFVHEIKR